MTERGDDLTVGPAVQGLLADVDEALRAAATGDLELWRLDDDQASAAVQQTYRLVDRLQQVAWRLLGEVDARGLPAKVGACSTQAWLAHTLRVRPQTAKRDVEVARLLRRAETTEAAPATAGRRGTDSGCEGAATRDGMTAGTVNAEQARVIATALTELPGETPPDLRVLAEHTLASEATRHGPVELTRLGHAIHERIAPDAADARLGRLLEREERRARQRRGATRFDDGHGTVTYRLRIGVDDDAHLFPVLDALAAPTPSADGARDLRTAPQRLADAFVEAFRRVSLDGGLPDRGGDRPRVVITIDHDTLTAGVGAGLIVDTHTPLSVAAVRRLACDAQILPQVLAGDGQILDQGRARRTFDGPLRLAVLTRDKGCVHPGCTRPPRWCDIHHVQPWWAGGTTRLNNGVTLCGHHHRLYDQGTWQITFTPDGIPEARPPTWLDPDQRPIRHSRFATRAGPSG